MVDELTEISGGELEAVSHLLGTSLDLQVSFVAMIIGIIGIAMGYKKFSAWILSREVYYYRPHLARFLRRLALPVFAIALVTVMNAHIQTDILSVGGAGAEEMRAQAMFTKILYTFNIIVIGYTVAHSLPIMLAKREATALEKADFEAWFDMRGFKDDDGDLFHALYRWTAPNAAPEGMTDAEFKEKLKDDDGRRMLEEFRTPQGNTIGGYERIGNAYEKWKMSERAKYKAYFQDCITGNNQSGRKLRLDAKPSEIFPIDAWREEKRASEYDQVVPSIKPPGYAKKKRDDMPKTVKQFLPIAIFAATILGVMGWWGVDLFVLATATGGFSIGLGLALQETMQNYFAYIMIRKDKIVKEGERVRLESGYNGYVHKITSRVTYIRHALNESIAIIPTRQLVTAEIINYTQNNELVPASVDVGVSYLNDPKQVISILTKVGKRAMAEITDDKGKHLVRQIRCPYLDMQKASCGCDKDLHVSVTQPAVRFNHFNDSSLDFTLWLYVRDYGSQFRVKTRIRLMIYEEFKKYDIRIPWPIRTIYHGDEKREDEEIASRDQDRKNVRKEYGLADLGGTEDGQ